MAHLLKGTGKRFGSGGVLNPSTALPRVFGIRDSFLRRKVEHEVASDALVNRVKARQPIRVAVTGGAGQIGYNTVFRLANGEMLGGTPIDLSILELPFAMDAAQGVKMELQDCAFPLLNSITVTDDAREAFDGCEVALLIGSKPRGPGMERADLLKENGQIFQKIGQVLNDKAERHCRVTVVGNPCNTNCLIAMNNAPDLPVKNFTAMTRLDHDRGLSILARKTMMDVEEINYFAVWGNHSAKMYPDLRNTLIHGSPWDELIGMMRAERYYKNEFIPKVQQRGARIIQVRGSSSAASAGSACLAHTRDWILGTKREDWVSMAVCSQGEYGVPKGLIFSYPMFCRGGGYEIVSVPKHIDEYSQWQLEENIYELEMERDTVAAYLPN